MSYFPMCIQLAGERVLLVGNGRQIQEKIDKLGPFGALIEQLNGLTEADLEPRPMMVVIGDLAREEAEKYCSLCRKCHIPVNVVDQPALCTFFFPSLISRGDLTISVSTGGKSPGTAAFLRQQIEQQLPDQTDEILESLYSLRQRLKVSVAGGLARQRMKAATELAFDANRSLTEEEMDRFCTDE